MSKYLDLNRSQHLNDHAKDYFNCYLIVMLNAAKGLQIQYQISENQHEQI